MAAKTFALCSCYFTHNVFLQRYRLHCVYYDTQQFGADYRELLKEKGCKTQEEYDQVLKEVHREVERRRSESEETSSRTQTIKLGYHPLYPHIYTLSEQYLDREFLEVVKYCKSPGATAEGLLDIITEEEVPNVYSFPMLTEEFCHLLLQELDYFESSEMPKGRPNSMNNYGILLSELGFDSKFLDTLREDYLQPLAVLLYPEWVGGPSGLDSHKAFTVSYQLEGDRELAYHYDNAEVTLNVCLGASFAGGELSFGPMAGEPGSLWKQRYTHRVGRGLLHRGRQRHQAHPVTGGKRVNLIIWMRSSEIRNGRCPMCGDQPSLVPCSEEGSYGDGFTLVTTSNDSVINTCRTL